MIRSLLDYCRRWPYLILLLALLALLVIQPIASMLGVMDGLFDALFVVVLTVLIFLVSGERVWRFIAFGLCVPAAALNIGGRFLSTNAYNVSLSMSHLVGALFLLMVVGKIVRSILSSQELSVDSIFAAICGYLLLGVAWGLAYAAIYAIAPNSFQFADAIQPHMESTDYSQDFFMYYSFVTLTTVGYGDIAATSIPARTLSWVEALIGQLYLAVLIAGLVGAVVARSRVPNR